MPLPSRRPVFTLVEVIVVLIIIGILAAIAAPRFLDMATDARRSAARAGINECKATLSVAYAKAYVDKGGEEPTLQEVLDAAGMADGGSYTFGDVEVEIKAKGTVVEIEASRVRGVKVKKVHDEWEKPVQ
jgi:prepilin-type N-terminal cleavage/methylation domain-containing protein